MCQKYSQFGALVNDVPHAQKILHSPQGVVVLLRQLRKYFISQQRNLSVFLGVKRETEANNKSHPCLERASGTTSQLSAPQTTTTTSLLLLLHHHRRRRLLLLSSHALHPSCLLKACPAGPGCTCVVQQQRNRPKLLTALPLHFLPPSISTAATTTSSSLPLHSALSFPAAPASCSV